MNQEQEIKQLKEVIRLLNRQVDLLRNHTQFTSPTHISDCERFDENQKNIIRIFNDE